jgi:hypothetical protein
MNSMVIDRARNVNRIAAFLDAPTAPGAGLREVNPAELEGVDGAFWAEVGAGFLIGVGVGALIVLAVV